MKKHKIILDDYCVRVIETPVKRIDFNASMADGYELSSTYIVKVGMCEGRSLAVTGQQFMEFQKICRRWFTGVCLDNGFTSVEVEEIE